ncbi:MAG TPA: hypothetical protein VHN77_00985 [Phycisphaerales bacterium]|nr:hypothetical protein [Phycisphaerales bacterium]
MPAKTIDTPTPRGKLLLLQAVTIWATVVVLFVLIAWRTRMGYWVSPGTIFPQAPDGYSFQWRGDPVAGWSSGSDPHISRDLIRKVLSDVGALEDLSTADSLRWGEGRAWFAQSEGEGQAVLCMTYLDHKPWHGPVARRHEVLATVSGDVLSHQWHRERFAQFDEEEILIIQLLGAVVCLVIPPWGIAAVITIARLAFARDRIASGLCSKCAYPTAGLMGITCPECGTLLPKQPPAPAQD